MGPRTTPGWCEQAIAEDGPAERAARVALAAENTWDHRVEEISALVEERWTVGWTSRRVETMRILLPTMRDPGQIGGTSTHIAMLTRGLEETGHEAAAALPGRYDPGSAAQGGADLAGRGAQPGADAAGA